MSKQPQAQITLAKEIHSRFHAMKTYGKEPESLDSIVKVFLSDLADYDPAEIMQAIKTHSQRSQEFPTVADIVGLIKRGGKPPLKESDVVTVRKKDPEYRTPEDWQLLRDWDAQQQDGLESDYRDPVREQAKDDEILRLRQSVQELRAENARAWAEVKMLRSRAELPKPSLTMDEKVRRTIDGMREAGAPEEDIREFAAPYGVQV